MEIRANQEKNMKKRIFNKKISILKVTQPSSFYQITLSFPSLSIDNSVSAVVFFLNRGANS